MQVRKRTQFWTLYRKEMLETLRDTLSLFLIIGLPLLLYPATAFLGMVGVSKTLEQNQEKPLPVAELWGEAPPEWVSVLETQFNLIVSETPADHCAVAAERLQGEAADLIIAVGLPPCGLEAPAAQDPAAQAPAEAPAEPDPAFQVVQLLYDASRDSSEEAADVGQTAVQAGSKALTERILAQHHIDQRWSEPYVAERINLASPDRMAAFVLSKVLPLLLVVLVALSAFYPAIDFVAGEKERGTMETLCATPCSRLTVLASKYAAVVSVALISTLANLLSVAFTFQLTLAQQDLLPESISLPWQTLLLSGLLLLPAALFFSALMIATATLARDFKEAQNFATPVFSLCIIPASLGLLPMMQLTPVTAIIPGLNVTLAIQAAILGKLSWGLALESVGSQLLYAYLLVRLGCRFFASEQVMFGHGLDFSKLGRALWHPKARTTPLPPAAGYLLFLVVALLTIYVGPLIAFESETGSLIVAQALVVLLPCCLFLWFYRQPLRDLGFKMPQAKSMVASALMGLGTFALLVLISFLTFELYPQGEAEVQPLEESLNQVLVESPNLLSFAVIALFPAVTEEFAFRGFMLKAFEKYGPLAAALTTATLFGLIHLSPYRFLPTFCLGLGAAYAVYKSGAIANAMLIHALSNGLVTAISLYPALSERLNFFHIALMLPLLPLGMFLLNRQSPKPLNEDDFFVP